MLYKLTTMMLLATATYAGTRTCGGDITTIENLILASCGAGGTSGCQQLGDLHDRCQLALCNDVGEADKRYFGAILSGDEWTQCVNGKL
jgi:hypothetical protein